ncbi:MAG TPA: hypothetical protein VGQ83_39255 [Polyangia bacterium]|jgi:hypothetical protein
MRAPSELREWLTAGAAALLAQGAARGARRDAAQALHDLFRAITDPEAGDDPADARDLPLPTGRALAPLSAGRCVIDFMRTSCYLRALRLAIAEAGRRCGAVPVHVLYAGCGPFAALAVPLMPGLTEGAVTFTLLEVNARALAHARAVIEALGLGGFVRAYVQADATVWRHDAGAPVHVVVAEALQAGLEQEPQVALTANLGPQLADGGIFVPERITLRACLADRAREHDPAGGGSRSGDRVRVDLGPVLEITAAGLDGGRWQDHPGAAAGAVLPAATVVIPRHEVAARDFFILTHLEAGGGLALGDYDSGLTCPRLLHELRGLAPGTAVAFTYHVGARPGLRAEVVRRPR